jgi:hypothetical protein
MPSERILGRQSVEISNELARLMAEQTEFFKKGTWAKHAQDELHGHEVLRDRVRELFAELGQSRKAARLESAPTTLY